MEIKDLESISHARNYLGKCIFDKAKIKKPAIWFITHCTDNKENQHIDFVHVMLHHKIYNNG